jgi:phage shock protein PspC (stress-responsive transcriptional regulator)
MCGVVAVDDHQVMTTPAPGIGAPAVLYAVCWIVMPEDTDDARPDTKEGGFTTDDA